MSTKQDIPYGYCQCGCGQKTTLAPANCAPRGIVKGTPRRFISGHNMSGLASRSPEDRFWEKVDKGGADECWEWRAALRNGYGHFGWSRRDLRYAHRVAYELCVGPIPEGLQLDHLCRNRKCVNPAHLEPVTQGENIRRGNAARAAGMPAYGKDGTLEACRKGQG